MRPSTRLQSVLLVVFASLLTFGILARSPAADLIFVESGVPKAVVEEGQPWRRASGFLELQGTGSILWADAVIEAGDFSLAVELEIQQLKNSAASFCFENRSHIGFEGAEGAPFLEGPLFGSRVEFLENVAGKFPVAKSFELTIARSGTQLTVAVDGATVLQREITAERLGRFGLRPWRSNMRVAEFRGQGNFASYAEQGDWAAGLAFKPVDVYQSNTEGYHTFRIPSLIVTKQGTLLAFAEGRKAGGGDAGNIDLLVKRSSDGGQTWSQPIVVWDDDNNTCGNPTPVVDAETGRIWLPMTWNLGSDHEREIMANKSQFPRRCYMTFSDDDGLTWDTPKEMPHLRMDHWRWYATGPDKGIQLTRGAHRGRMVVPCNHSDHRDPAQHPYRSHVIYSDDHGVTWQLGGVIGEKTNESTIVELSDGRILDNMRSYHGKQRRAVAISSDGGESWSEVTLDEALLEPVCQASILRLTWPESDDLPGRVVFSNPASTARARLTLRVSHDDGQTWAHSRCLYHGSAAYSCLARLPNGELAVLFERDQYRQISLARVTIDWLEAGQ